MCLGRQLTHCALSIAVDTLTDRIAKHIIHRNSAAANAIDTVLNDDWSRFIQWLTKARLEAMYHHINVFIALCIEIINAE